MALNGGEIRREEQVDGPWHTPSALGLPDPLPLPNVSPCSCPGSPREGSSGWHHFLHTLVVQTVKNLPPGQETQFSSLDWEDPLEEEMATHSSILAWRIP